MNVTDVPAQKVLSASLLVNPAVGVTGCAFIVNDDGEDTNVPFEFEAVTE